MNKPKYPKKYRKVTPKILKEIKSLALSGWSHADIAVKFNLHRVTVTRRLDPKARERALAGTRAWLKIRTQDPKYREKVREAIRKNVNDRYHSDARYRRFLIDLSVVDKIKRREYIKKYSREYYQRRKNENK